MSVSDVRCIGVVVPARNEEMTVAACVASVQAAADRVDVPVRVVVVVNGSTDSTAARAEAAGAVVLEDPHANVGAARRLGVDHHLSSGVDGLWLAFTDADSVVPPDWLSTQLTCARAGADAVLGTIRLPPGAGELYPAWSASYAGRISGDRHDHVHGANLGVGAAVYRAVGGFRALETGEDVELVRRLEQQGAHLVRTVATPVTTSARTVGRVRHGVSTDLHADASARAELPCSEAQ